ncbi:MAG TPA: ISL3 family transposase [Gemmatimonadaceae bacterium]|nr:ISL3 family transposase [Gemmatimonadaceae bacterium]
MAYEEITAMLGGWPGFRLVDVSREPATASHPVPKIVLTLEAVSGHPKRCSRCGSVVKEIHDISPREVRDLPILDAETWLVVPRARVECPTCGPTVEEVEWLDRYQRMTRRMAEFIARLACILPLKHVADLMGIGWDTVKQIDKRSLQKRLGDVDLDGVRVIAIDEFAIRRGHRYATIVVEPTTKRVLWVGNGRSGEDLRPFFHLLGKERCSQIEAVVTDMFPPYVREIRDNCPQARIVYDLFHVIARYGNEVINQVRVAETNKIARAGSLHDSKTRALRRVIKGTRWLLLKNRQNLAGKNEEIRLTELLEANHALFVVYVLKEDLKDLWNHRSITEAREAWNDWYSRAMTSHIPQLVDFARRLSRRIEQILNHCLYPLHTGIVEGINNKIKVLKRTAYGFRDDAYFFLKIRAAFPGIPG